MKSTKKREIGVGDNLYGIPIDDIVTPIELEEIKTTSRKTVSGKRRKRAKKPRTFRLTNINIPKIKLGQESAYIVSGVIAVLFLLIVFKKPIMSHIAPKLYVSSAIEQTVSEIADDSEDNIKSFLGFDLRKKKEFSLRFEGKAHSDTLSYMDGISIGGNVGYSKGQKNLCGLWQYSEKDEPVTSAILYLNNDEVAFSLPEIMGEYWLAPTKTFGKAWNESGMRKISYANAMDEEFDISFSNIFGDGFFTEKGKKEIIKLTDRILSKSHGGYQGKTKKDINGKTKKCRSFTFTFPEDEAEKYISSLAELILNDTSCKQKLSCMGIYGNAVEKLGDISARLSDGVSFSGIRMDVLEYKGAVASLNILAHYNENGNNVCFSLTFDAQNTKNPLDHMTFSVSNGDNFSILFYSKGNRTKQQYFYDTKFEIISNIDRFSFDNAFSSDFENETISGALNVFKNGKSDNIEYSGKCRQKGGLSLELDKVNVTTLTTDARTVSGEFFVKAEPRMNIGKVNVAGKRNIFEMDKTETENYLKKLQENEKMKKFLDITRRISGKIR